MLELWLVRHPEVAQSWSKTCYGDLDCPLADNWQLELDEVDSDLQLLSFAEIWHSQANRAKAPAFQIAERTRTESVFESELLNERNFGSWQGVLWDRIPSEELEHAHDMLDHPQTYRPGGTGETTQEVIQRGQKWFAALAARLRSELHRASSNQETVKPTAPILVFSHSGWITPFAGSCLGLDPPDWTPYYLKPFGGIVLAFDEDLSLVSSSVHPTHFFKNVCNPNR
jgi:broad specificity phosphatase PhoE